MLKKFLLFSLFFSFGLIRFANLSGRMPFAWDQARDIKAVSEMIQTHRPKLIGPVVRGEGGFLLGSLYYYFLLPGQLLTHGQPLALAVTSILIFLIFVLSLYFFLSHIETSFVALGVSSLFGFSWYFVGFSQISWNAALILPYVLGIYWLFQWWTPATQSKALPLSGFFWGLAWQVHPSLFFLVPLLWLFKLRHPSIKTLSLTLAGLVFAMAPLIIFDFRHHFLNTRLFLKFFHQSSPHHLSLSFLLYPLLFKFILTLSFWIFGIPNFWLGLGLSSLLVLSFIIYRHHPLVRFSWWLLITNLLGLFLLHDLNFAEYYFLPSALASVYLIVKLIDLLSPKLSYLLLIGILFINITRYQFSTLPYSLKTKQAVVININQKAHQADVFYQLPLGRTFGFDYLFHQLGFILDPQSSLKIYLQENGQPLPQPSHQHYLETIHVFNYQLSFFVVE